MGSFEKKINKGELECHSSTKGNGNTSREQKFFNAIPNIIDKQKVNTHYSFFFPFRGSVSQRKEPCPFLFYILHFNYVIC